MAHRTRGTAACAAAVVVAASLAVGPPAAASGWPSRSGETTSLVTRTPTGVPVGATDIEISRDGRFVVYDTLDPAAVGTTNPRSEAGTFLVDRLDHRVVRIDLGPDGVPVPGTALGLTMSASGRYVAFNRSAFDLDDQGPLGVYRYDRVTGALELIVPSPPPDPSEFPVDPPAGQPVAVSDNGRLVAVNVPPAGSRPGRTVVVDVATGTERAARGSADPAADPHITTMSDDGRCVLLTTNEPIAAADDNTSRDVYLLNRRSGAYRLVSSGPDGNAVGGIAQAVSQDCRRVAFTSSAPELAAAGVPAGTTAAFVRDLRRHRLTRLSVTRTGRALRSPVSTVRLSRRGDVAMFVTDAPDVVVADTNGRRDAFVRDVRSGRVRRVSLTASGSQIDGGTEIAALSRDGRSVAFVALGVVPGGPQVSGTYGYVRGTRWALRR